MLNFYIFQCPPDETEPRNTLNILSQHLGLPPATLRFRMCCFMKKHRQYSMTIADNILRCKKLDFDDYLLCMEQDAPLDEIAIVVIALMFHFHICILTETKFWTTSREHKIGMCSLILGLTGNLEFVPLHHCTTQSGHSSFEQENQPDYVNNNDSNQHNTSADSSISLTDKLSGVFDVNELSVFIKEHAEQMTRPSPPTPKDRTPVSSPLPAEKKFIFIQHGIKCHNKQVQKFNCVLCTFFFLLKKNLMHTFVVVILRLNLNVDIVKSNTRVPMAVPSMRSRMLVIILNVNFVIKVFSFQRV